MTREEKRLAKFEAVDFSTTAKLPLGDKWAQGFAGWATGVPWVLFGYFLTYFYTDVLGISGTEAGAIILFARLFDAFTDLCIGWCIDHFNFKRGKYRVWTYFSLIPQFILFILVWLCIPGSSHILRLITAWIGYGLYGSIGATLCFIPMNCQMTNMTRNQEERASITGLRGVTQNLGTLLVVLVFLPMTQLFGGNSGNVAGGFFWTAVIFAALTTLPVLWNYVISEKYELNADGSYREHLIDKDKIAGVKVKIGTQLKELVENRPAMITVISTFIMYIFQGIRSGTVVYVYDYYFQLPELTSIALFFNCATAMLGAMSLKYLIKWFKDTNRAYIITMVLSAGLYLLWYFLVLGMGREAATESMKLGRPMFILYALCGFLQGAHYMYPNILLPQAIDYGKWKYGRNQAGFVFACYGFCLTVGGAIGGAALGFMLDGIGYVAGESQGEATLNSMLFVGVLVPVILTAIQAAIQAFYGFNDKKHKQCIDEMMATEAAEEAAAKA